MNSYSTWIGSSTLDRGLLPDFQLDRNRLNALCSSVEAVWLKELFESRFGLFWSSLIIYRSSSTVGYYWFSLSSCVIILILGRLLPLMTLWPLQLNRLPCLSHTLPPSFIISWEDGCWLVPCLWTSRTVLRLLIKSTDASYNCPYDGEALDRSVFEQSQQTISL